MAIQQAAVTQAEQTLKQAQLKLEQATLKAPFAGVVTAVNIVPGSNASGSNSSSSNSTSSSTSSSSSSSGAISLIDRSTLHVDLKLSENDVAKVQLGQNVALTIDALKDWQAAGTVSYIAPSSETSNGADKQDNVLVVPSTALLPKGAGHAVQVVSADGKTTSEVDVQTGLSDGTNTEITSGLNAGDKVVTTPSTTTTTQRSGGLFGGP